jgi:putative DNA-invertase from lambdoid prophage Rac
MAAHGYIRVSTDRQAEEGESLGTQQRQIEGYAMMIGVTLDHVYVERGVSGSKPFGERQEGTRLLEACKPGDTLITPKLDRMFRSSLDALNVLGDLKERDVALHMIDLGGDVTGNGISKLVFTILSAVAEAERDRIRERILDVKSDQRKRNRFLGGTAPFGWQVGEDGMLVEVPEQQTVIREITELRREGLSLRAIAASVGGAVSHVTVKSILSQWASPHKEALVR